MEPSTFFTATQDANGGVDVTVACYCRSTLIRTEHGERPAEQLQIGDRVMTLSGTAGAIRWIGRRSYDSRFIAGNRERLPVRILAGALGEGMPQRDLSVSPHHAMFIDGVLVPALALINGTTIVQQDDVALVEYFHLELGAHHVIFAEGALSESYVDDGCRGAFQNAAEYYALYPGVAEGLPARYCAPLVENGEALEVIRRHVAVWAAELRADVRSRSAA